MVEVEITVSTAVSTLVFIWEGLTLKLQHVPTSDLCGVR